ncbi:MAG TPA: acyloxyacyl hydrolase [Verrucomicrobiae bacterium]|nr:acyloxyacyl hydrolase [Verrucomicrobiae bacterium]
MLLGSATVAPVMALAQTTTPTADLGIQANLAFESRSPQIWTGAVGGGFDVAAQSFSVNAGATCGIALLGGREVHDLALVGLSYGEVFGPLRGAGHWFQGNTELRFELFGGSQFSPSHAWLVGLTPHLRYHFATGTRWVPFVDCGAGVTATSIREPDLGGVFEFNLQAAAGVQWFVRNNVALTLEARYLHLSSARIYRPNLGLNTIAGMAGVTFFF